MQCKVLKYEDKEGEEERENIFCSKATVLYKYCNFK